MKAILMAAGLGSRLAKNLDRPKCTFQIGGIPLLYRTVSMLKENGIQVSVVVGYKKEVIFRLLREFDITYYFNPFFRATNSMASLWFAREELYGQEDIILANADVFWEQAILDDILTEHRSAVLMGDKLRTEKGDYFFETLDDKLIGFGKEMDVERRSCEYVGIAKIAGSFTSAFREHLQSLIDKEYYHLWWENVLYEYCNTDPVFVRDVDGKFWGEIDSMQDYNRIEAYCRTRMREYAAAERGLNT